MPLYLTEADVQALLTPAEAVAALEDAFRAQGQGRAQNEPRHRLVMKPAVLHVLSGALPGGMGVKAYVSTPSGIGFVVLLFDPENGSLQAVLEANRLGQLRTGAASAVAARLLARPGSSRVGLVGTGYQAWGQMETLATVFPLSKVQVYGRDPERLKAFVARLQTELGLPAEAVSNVAAACTSVDILVTATKADVPFIQPQHLSAGLHVNAVGTNWARNGELTTDAVLRFDRIVVDDVRQAEHEAGDLLPAVRERRMAWDNVKPLAELFSGWAPGRSGDDEITLFKSLGVGLEDVAAAQLVYRKAVAAGRGQALGQGRSAPS